MDRDKMLKLVKKVLLSYFEDEDLRHETCENLFVYDVTGTFAYSPLTDEEEETALKLFEDCYKEVQTALVKFLRTGGDK